MELIALVFDLDYYKDVYCKGCVVDFSGGLKGYLENHFSNCAAPNAEFLGNPELLYVVKDNKRGCKLDEWSQPITQESFLNIFGEYIVDKNGHNKNQKLDLLKNNLNEIAKHSPNELENLLTSATEVYWQRYMINALASNLDYKLEESSIDYIETHKTAALKSAVTILTHHITHHAGDSKHAEFLANLLAQPGFDASIRETALTKFIKEAKGIKDSQVFTSFEKTLAYNKPDNKLVLTLAQAAQSSAYVPSLESLIYFEKLLDSEVVPNSEIDEQKLGAAAISKTLQSILKNPDGVKDFAMVEQKLNLLLVKMGKLSTSLVNAVFDVYNHEQTYFTNVVIDIVATDKGLPKEVLSKLLEPLTTLKEIKVALFIGLRLVQNHINLPQELLTYFKGFSEHADKAIRLMAAKLFNQIEHGTPKADARFEMDIEMLGWRLEDLDRLTKNITAENLPVAMSALAKLYDYRVTTEDFDRNGQTA